MNIIKTKIHRNLVATIGISVLALLLISNFTTENQTQVQAESKLKELAGYAWGSNGPKPEEVPSGLSLGDLPPAGVGWISMNCNNTSSCDQSDYKVTLDEETGELTGYAWASNGVSYDSDGNAIPDGLGWLQFGGLSGFPQGNGTESANAYIDENGNMQGWARFLSYGGDVMEDETETSSAVEGYLVTSEYYLPCNGEEFYNDFVENLSDNIGWLKSDQIDGCGKWYSGYNYTLDKNSPVDQYHEKTSVTDDENITLISKYYLNRDKDGDNQNDKTLVNRRENDSTAAIYTSVIDGTGYLENNGSFCDLNLSAAVYLGDATVETYNNNQLVATDPNDPHFNLISVDPDNSETVISSINPIIDGVDCGTIRVVLEPVLESGNTDSIVSDQLAWDGWVSLSGNTEDGGSYGVERDGNNLKGYAWGGDVVGWVTFDHEFGGVTIEEATAQCGSIDGTDISRIDDKTDAQLCENGEVAELTDNIDTWTWNCVVDDGWGITETETPNRECGAGCQDGYIIGDDGECIEDPDDDPNDPNDPDDPGNETGEGTVEDMIFEAVPRIINRGGTCNMEWSITTPNADLISCKITSDFAKDPEKPIIFDEGDSGTINGTESFNNIDATTQYTLTCSDSAGAELMSQTARCSINPNFIEF